MAEITTDRVLETTTTTGTGSLTLAGAITGYRAFSAVCVNGDTVRGYIEAVDANGIPTGDWETGIYTWSTGGVLARTAVQASSNAGAAVAFVAGTKRVGLGVIASKLTPSYVWASRPSALTFGIGTQIRITDVGTSAAGSLWFTDGTNWRPVNGAVTLKQIGGSLATPASSYTGATANAQIVQPGGNLKFPAGMLLPGAIISIGSIERYVTVGSTNIVRQFRIGNTGTLTNDYTVQPFSFQAGWSVVSDFRISVASSTVLTTTGGTAPNGTQYNSTSDISGARIDTTVDMYLTIETYLNAVADIYQMVSLTVSLYQ